MVVRRGPELLSTRRGRWFPGAVGLTTKSGPTAVAAREYSTARTRIEDTQFRTYQPCIKTSKSTKELW
ncbi:hypothetical protein PC128_g22601 [Phytophthora cactorum]|nr:hypothetical protein PC128_g22601 [Phytophthora cactorum]